MISRIILVLGTIVSIQVLGQEDEASTTKKINYQINDDYKAGSHLIYNCARNYYTCVDEDSYSKCSDNRKDAIELKREFYPCAPLKKYSTKTECAKKNYEVVESLAKKRFCYPKNK